MKEHYGVIWSTSPTPLVGQSLVDIGIWDTNIKTKSASFQIQNLLKPATSDELGYYSLHGKRKKIWLSFTFLWNWKIVYLNFQSYKNTLFRAKLKRTPRIARCAPWCWMLNRSKILGKPPASTMATWLWTSYIKFKNNISKE